MRETSNLLRQVFVRLDGAKFYGILKAANEGATNVRATYRILFVKNPALVIAGDVVKANGQLIILMLHPNDSQHETSFKAAYVQDIATWERKFKQTDNVSGVPNSPGSFVPMGNLYINFDMPEEVNAGVLTDTRYRFITGQNILVGDKVNGRVVKTIYELLGVKLAFAE